MLFTGIIFLACNVTLDTNTDVLNLENCTPTYTEDQSLTEITTSTPTPTVDFDCEPPVVQTPDVQTPVIDNSQSDASRYAPTIIAGSGLGLLALAGVGAFIVNRKKKEPEPESNLEQEKDIEHVQPEVEIPENILSSSQKFQRSYNNII